MASGTFYADGILETFKGTTAFSARTSVWVSLHTAAPGGTGANEATWSKYARKKLTKGNWGAVTGTVAVNRRIQYKSTITFSTVGTTTAGETMQAVGIWNAASGGSFLVGGSLNTSIALAAGSVPSFSASALDIQQD